MAYKDKAKENEYKNQWQRENKERIAVLVPKGDKERIKAAAEQQGQSVNAWINDAIDAKLNG